jgi:hypothetical protein
MSPLFAGRMILLILAWILPGAAAIRWLLPRARSDERWGLATAISPGLFALMVTPMLMAQVSPRTAGTISLVISGLLLVLAPRGRGLPDGERAPEARNGLMVGWIVATIAALVIAAFSISSEWWRVSYDAWGHQAIVQSMTRSGLPPGDPWFAGLRLHYAWVYHAVVLSLWKVTGVDTFTIMSLLAAGSLFSLCLSASGLAARLPRAHVGWTLAVLLLGLNALFPLFLPIAAGRALTGEVRGMDELRRMFAITPLSWGTVGPFLRLLGGKDFFLSKFLTATPFSLALAMGVAWAGTLRRSLPTIGEAAERTRTSPRLEAVTAFLLALVSGCFHPIVGIYLAAMAVGLGGLAVLGVVRADRLTRDVLTWSMATLVGFIPAAWFISTLIGSQGNSGIPIGFSAMKWLGLLSCVALGLVLTVRPLMRMLRNGGADRIWALWVLLSLGMGLAVRLPGPTPFFTVDKFSYLVWIPLALTAGPELAAWMRGRSRTWRIVIALLLFGPVNALALASRVADPAASHVQPWTTDGHAWMRERLPADAVLLTPPGDFDICVFANRDQYLGPREDAMLRGYPREEIERRRDLLGRLFAGQVLTDEDRAQLAELGRPVYVVWPNPGAAWAPWTPGAFSRMHGLAFPPPASIMDVAIHVSANYVVAEVPFGRE